MKYTFENDSRIDNKLTVLWEVWRDERDEIYDAEGGNMLSYWDDESLNNWVAFLKTLPGVVDAKYGLNRTYLSFNEESDLSLFLLRFG